MLLDPDPRSSRARSRILPTRHLPGDPRRWEMLWHIWVKLQPPHVPLHHLHSRQEGSPRQPRAPTQLPTSTTKAEAAEMRQGLKNDAKKGVKHPAGTPTLTLLLPWDPG